MPTACARAAATPCSRRTAGRCSPSPKELERIVAHAEEPDGGALFVADSNRVMRSTDGGCSWKTGLRGADADRPGHARPTVLVPRISRLTVVPGTDTVLLVVDGVARAAASQVLRSDEGGDEGTWQAVEGPAAGDRRPRDRRARRLPRPPYLITGVANAIGDNEPAGASGLLFRSDDDGHDVDAARRQRRGLEAGGRAGHRRHVRLGRARQRLRPDRRRTRAPTSST